VGGVAGGHSPRADRSPLDWAAHAASGRAELQLAGAGLDQRASTPAAARPRDRLEDLHAAFRPLASS
jgi:hypothetical protein